MYGQVQLPQKAQVHPFWVETACSEGRNDTQAGTHAPDLDALFSKA